MKKLFIIINIFLCLQLLTAQNHLNAQRLNITGWVSDANTSETLPGVYVTIKGTTTGTMTDSKGKYSLDVEPGTTLVYSYVGYLPEEIIVQSKTVINVSLVVDIVELNEVVKIGYGGSSKKRDLTGAVSVIKTDDLNASNPLSLEQGLQGKIAGVNVVSNDGAPGGGMSVQIRGTNTFSGSGEPLYVIDGVAISASNDAATPMSGSIADPNSYARQQINALSFLDPRDIESIEILKDASATAIYGSRGANGVVLITTKAGKKGQQARIEANAEFSLSNIRKFTDVMSGKEYTQYINDVNYWTNYWKNYNPATGTSSYVPQPFDVPYPGIFNHTTGEYNKGPDDFSTERNIWQRAIIQTAKTQKYSVGMSGGSETTSYTLRYNHVEQEGIVKKTKYQRDGLNFNIDQKAQDWLTLGANGNIAFVNYNLVNCANTADQGMMGLIKTAIYARPVDAEEPTSFWDEGGFWATSSPLAYISSPDRTQETSIFGNLYTEIAFLPSLKLRSNLGYNHNNTQRHHYYNSHLYEGKSEQYGDGYAQAGFNKFHSLSFENILTFDKSYGNHYINVMGTFSMNKYGANNYSMDVRGFGTDLTEGYDFSSAKGIPNVWSNRNESALMSYLGRINYIYDSKYYITANIRRDGASNFAKNNKWGTFGSFVVAYNIAEENFMDKMAWLDLFKIRYSYGTTGNQAIGAYASLAQYVSANYPFEGTVQNGYILSSTHPGNANLKWETTRQHNLGLDMSALNSRFNFTMDLYYKHTFDLLQNKSVAMSTGVMQIPMNVGEVENKGLELSVSGMAISKPDFSWEIAANWSANRNKVLKFGDNRDAQAVYGPYRLTGLLLKEGYPIGQLYGYIEDGYWDSIDEYKNSSYYAYIAENNPSEVPSDAVIAQNYLGEIRYKDCNSDGQLNEEDRRMIGNVNPDFIYGFTNTFNYKKLSLSIFLQGVQGNDILNAILLDFNSTSTWPNRPPNQLDNAWTPERAVNNPGIIRYPKMGENLSRTTRFTRRYIEDGSYLKLKNISLSYKLDRPFHMNYIRNITLTLSATNLFTITNYSGFDPEVNSAGSGNASWRGIDVGAYPSSRTVTFALNMIL